MKFLVLYMAPTAAMDEMMKNATPEQQKAGMEEWKKWAMSHKEIDMGAPVGKNKRVTKDAVSDTRNEVGGYSFVEAASQDEAAALFKDSPHFQLPGAYIDILAVGSMPE